MRSLPSLNDQCATTVRHLTEGPQPPTLDSITARVYPPGGPRHLHLHPWEPASGDLPATRITRRDADHVFFPSDTSAPHQNHIILRELASRALSQSSRPAARVEPHPAAQLLPKLPAELLQRGVTGPHVQVDEAMVEMVATELGLLINTPTPVATRRLSGMVELHRSLTDGQDPQLEPANDFARAYRLVIDINDALWQLRPYLAPASTPTPHDARPLRDIFEAFHAARRWRAAHLARHGARPQTTLSAMPRGGHDLRSELRRLRLLAACFHTLDSSYGVTPAARAEHLPCAG